MRIVIYKIPNKEKVLYNLGQLLCKLVKNNKIAIFCEKETIEIVDKILWTFSTNVFLPHGIATNNKEENDKQPILIGNKINLLDRDIFCVLNENDLYNVLDKQKLPKSVNDLVYITQNDFNYEKIKNYSDVAKVNVFEKIKNFWHAVKL